MGAPPKADYPVITAAQLTEYDGIMFGISGRYGQYSGQIKSFMDSTGHLWATGALYGKAGGVFQV
jgi:NAD(P)H dehydrogenase (quinone)